MLERLNFDSDYKYSAMEGAIHLTRYIIAKEFCKNKVVLDVACGEGYGSSLMSNWGAEKIIGVDVSQEAIDKANKFFSTDKIQFNCNSAENMEFLESNSFDLIVSLETVEHIGNPDRFLKELKRLIRDDGTIILSCPNDWYYFPDVKEGNQYHMKKYKFNEFFEFAEKILGKPSLKMVGTPVEGFVNLTLSEKLDYGDRSQKLMLEYTDVICLEIPGEKIITPEISNYFVGVWNYGNQEIFNTNTSVIYPTIFYPGGRPIEVELRAMLDDARRQIEEKDKVYNEMLDDARRQIEEKDKVYSESLDDIKNQIDRNSYNLSVLEELLLKEKQKNRDLQIENSENNKYIDSIELELNEIKNSNSWKLVRKYYDFKDKL